MTKKEAMMELRGIRFEVLRKYISHIDRLSICMQDKTEYENYICIRDVSDSYNNLYVYGIGMIDSEFYKDGKYDYTTIGDRKNLALASCIEIVLSKDPRTDI